MSDGLSSWLLACLDVEAETARAALKWADEWASRNDDERRWSLDPEWPDGAVYVTGHFAPVLDAAAHIARQDPQATLDRVEALRAVVEMHRPRVFQTFDGDDQELDPPYDCTICWDVTDESARWPCPTLRALAYAYRRHPEWDPSWAPDGVSADA